MVLYLLNFHFSIVNVFDFRIIAKLFPIVPFLVDEVSASLWPFVSVLSIRSVRWHVSSVLPATAYHPQARNLFLHTSHRVKNIFRNMYPPTLQSDPFHGSVFLLLVPVLRFLLLLLLLCIQFSFLFKRVALTACPALS